MVLVAIGDFLQPCDNALHVPTHAECDHDVFGGVLKPVDLGRAITA